MIEILRTYEPTAVRETITRLRTLLADRMIAQKQIVDATGIEKTRFSRWINGHTSWRAIGRSDYEKLIDYMDRQNLFAEIVHKPRDFPSMEALAFHGMANFFKVGDADIARARRKLVGHYEGYRFSYYAAPDILLGSMEISYDAEAHCLKSVEHYRIPEKTLGHDCPEINFRRDGFIWPTRLNMFMMISEKTKGNDIQVMYINKALMNAISSDEGDMSAAEGIVLDWQGQDFYMTKIFLRKRHTPLPVSDIRLLRESEVPGPILSKLKEPFAGPHNFLKVYK